MTDEELGIAFEALGLTEENYRAILLLPLIRVAWADASLHTNERDVILGVAEARGLAGCPVIESWLDRAPDPEFWERGKAVLRELSYRRDIAPGELRRVADQAEDVARAAGGLFGVVFTIEQRERDALRDISGAFGIQAIDSLGTRSRRGAAAIEYTIVLGVAASTAMVGISVTGDAVAGSLNAVNGAVIGSSGGGDEAAVPVDGGSGNNRSGLGDGTNPGQGSGKGNSANTGTDNPSNAGLF